MESAEKTLGGCFTTQIVISLILTTILLIWNKDLLLLFGASENTIDYAVNYMNVYAIGTIFVQLTLGMNAFITAQGFAKTAMLSVLIGAILNIALDPIFIYAANMGVQGAALATIISQCVSCIWVIAFLCSKKALLRLKAKNLFVNPKIVLPCLALGLSAFIMQSSESIILVCFNSSLLKYGGDLAVGAMTIVSSVMQFAMLPLQGLGQGAQPITSYNYGAGNKDRVLKSFKLLLISSLTYSTILWIFVMAGPQIFAKMFTSDPELLQYTAKVCRVYFGAMFMFGIQIACQMTFVSLGNAPSSIVVAVVRKFVLLLPLIYLLPAVGSDPTMSIFMAEPIADAIAVTFTMILFAFQFRKALKNIKKPVKQQEINEPISDINNQ